MRDNIEAGKQYYAICTSVENGLFDNERVILLGKRDLPICVDLNCLGITPDGFFATKFFVNDIRRGIAIGFVYNCDGFSCGYRAVPIDSLTSAQEINLSERRE